MGAVLQPPRPAPNQARECSERTSQLPVAAPPDPTAERPWVGCPEFPPSQPLTPAGPQTLVGFCFFFCKMGVLGLSSSGSSKDEMREQMWESGKEGFGDS